jgi:hypothetical protein
VKGILIMNNKGFEYYFSERQLLKVLCRRRAILAKKEHDKLFNKRLLEYNNKSKIDKFYQMFPPRNKWIRLCKNERKNKTAVDINTIQIERTILRSTKNLKAKPKSEWQYQLFRFICDIKNTVLNGKYIVPVPNIQAQFKEIKHGVKVFRPIAYFDYKDRIIISQCNRYLNECFDHTFLDCSYAFRLRNMQGKSFSHHSAIEDVIAYKKRFITDKLWVSECDITKFYDCVNHYTIKKIYENKVKEVSSLGINVDDRANNLFSSYLDCYSFNHLVKQIKLGKNSEFGWVNDKQLKQINFNAINDRLGVPQGGALSCLIANLLMDVIDKKIQSMNDGDLFYARFCDDMILIHPNQSYCDKVLEQYSASLLDLGLISHPFTKFETYNKDFWKSKSKASYPWAKNGMDDNPKKNVPWLSFVGYQLSYDLRVRVRRSSLKKEIEKQIKETGKVINLIKKGKEFRVSKGSIKEGWNNG